MGAIHEVRGKVEDEIVRKLESLRVTDLVVLDLRNVRLEKIMANLYNEADVLCLVLPAEKMELVEEVFKLRSAVPQRTSVIVMLSNKLDPDTILVGLSKRSQFSSSSGTNVRFREFSISSSPGSFP